MHGNIVSSPFDQIHYRGMPRFVGIRESTTAEFIRAMMTHLESGQTRAQTATHIGHIEGYGGTHGAGRSQFTIH